VSGRAFGYTVSELGLILAFLFMVQMLRDRPAQATREDVVPIATFKSLERENDSLMAQVDSIRKHLRSPQLPSCVASKLVSGPLCSVTILGVDKFDVGDTSLTLTELQERYASELREAEKCECVHTIVARYAPELSTGAYDRALARLEGVFYVKRMGAVR